MGGWESSIGPFYGSESKDEKEAVLSGIRTRKAFDRAYKKIAKGNGGYTPSNKKRGLTDRQKRERENKRGDRMANRFTANVQKTIGMKSGKRRKTSKKSYLWRLISVS